MRFFYDCEFIEDGRTIELVSIGVVAEDGREFYGDLHRVRPHSGQSNGFGATCSINCRRPASPNWLSREAIRDQLLDFLTAGAGRMELWAWMAAYDHVCLAQLWGDMRALPRPIPRFTHDLRQRWEDAGSPVVPSAPPDQHDALADARHNVARWQAIESVRAEARAADRGIALGHRRAGFVLVKWWGRIASCESVC